MQQIDLVYQTLYSELVQRSLDAQFTSEFSLNGRFVPVTVKTRKFWYYDAAKEPGDSVQKRRTYVGPADDPEITKRVESFKDLKADQRARMRIVSTLVREARLPRPDPLTGDVVTALGTAGFFRLRGVLVGTVAFQCYAAHLGVRLFGATLQTGDTDFAQFHSIANAVEDSLPPVLDILRTIDSTFREIPHRADGRHTTQYATRSGYKVEFLTPNTGSDEYADRPTSMPSLGNTSAQPLRFLDFLIHQPVRAVLLHGPGIPVLVPAPERYAVHKLIIASRRLNDNNGSDKSAKDRMQAQELTLAMLSRREHETLADAYMEAWDRGSHWRDAISASLRRLEHETAVREGLAKGVTLLGANPTDYGLATP